MSVRWTKQQSQVIESRGCNLLVSAAAGSGKTAVLVERIIQMVIDKEHPVEIDRLLVMTFTNAAAAEMRERIGAAIEKKLMEMPDNEHLQMQAALVHHAQITTIDSFCLQLIRQYFNRLDLDPAFRIGDEGELTLLRMDVMAELLEDYYTSGNTQFEQFVETYGQGKNDVAIEDLILQTYRFSMSNPDPKGWLDSCKKESFEHNEWMDFLLQDMKLQIEELSLQLSDAYEACVDDTYLCAYEPMLASDKKQLATLLTCEAFSSLQDCLGKVSWDRLATIRSKEVDPETKAYVTGIRDRVKKAIKALQEQYCFASLEEMKADMEGSKPALSMLLELTENFANRYQEKKKDRNIVDFNDLEHGALQVLFEEQDGKRVFTEVADELSQYYEEVLVDEYQDSNLVQEALLEALSKERFGKPNVFMVGDVKQSIYRFRLARPELFLEKYHTYEPYEETGGAHRKIELHQNFRSRAQVLSGINDVFYKIMTKNMGNIHYTEAVALHSGAIFEETTGRVAEKLELLVVDTGTEKLGKLEDEAVDLTAKEIEAKLIIGKIKEMTDPETGLLVWDKKLGAYRIAQYRDIVILLRSTSGWAESFLTVFLNEGIPAYAESKMGYFNTLEVEIMLSLLGIIDNPRQDIPLTAVLKSPMVGLSDEELAWIRAYQKSQAEDQRGMYEAILGYQTNELGNQGIQSTIQRFLDLLAMLRKVSVYLPIHELMDVIYRETGYYDYIRAMPAGETRRANLDMLVEKAIAYGKTSYKGLFHFVRYIENLKKYQTDFGEATTIGEEDNTIRIMSIHKSKGLEFPIVFLAGMGKKFNKQDIYGKILIDPDLGIASEYIDLERRLKTTTLKKQVLRRKMELESLGEELRVLYVAMTRAKEKLVMTGTDRYLEKTLGKWNQISLVNGQVPYTILSTASHYLDWVLMSGCEVQEISVEQLVGDEVIRQITNEKNKEILLNLDPSTRFDETLRQQLEKRLGFQYPHKKALDLHTKMSVSELKKLGQMIDESESKQYIPQKQNNVTGATRGTAYHRVLEKLPFDQIDSQEDILTYLSQEEVSLVSPSVIWKFLNGSLGKRMIQAQKEHRLQKEKQFVMGIEDSEELVVVQGIIDAYLEESDGLVLIDYKTDRIQNKEVLKGYYQEQLRYYKKALEQITGNNVKEMILYSLTLQEEIYID